MAVPSLQRKLFLPIITILSSGLALATLLITVTASVSYNYLLNQGLETLAWGLESDVADYFLHIRDELLWEAQKELYIPLYDNPPDEDAIAEATSVMRQFVGYNKSISGIRITDDMGWVITSSSPVGRLYVGDREYFLNAMNGRDTVSAMVISRVTGRPFLAVAVPYHLPGQAEPSGIIYSPVDNNELCRQVIDDVRLGSGSYAFVVDSSGRIAAHPDRDMIYNFDLMDHEFGRTILSEGNGLIRYKLEGEERMARYFRNQKNGWTSVVSVNTREFFYQARRIQGIIISAMAFTLLLIALSVISTVRGVAASIGDLARESEIIASGLFHRRLSGGGSRELQSLASSFQTVVDALNTKVEEAVLAHEEGKIQASNELESVIDQLRSKKAEAEKNALELGFKSRELEKSLSALRESQAQLLEIEKQASLGRLVAGVAHEINTPLGIGITSISFSEDLVNALLAEIEEQGTLDDANLSTLKTLAEGITTTHQNIRRASQLVRNFKQVSVDQSSELKRPFELSEYMNEILQSLAPKWKHTKHVVDLAPSPIIPMISYPGALMQVFTNLIENSLIHGFSDNQAGSIGLELESYRDEAVITYTDDGCGMNPDTLNHIYDPFFTTNRTGGGSGLGMHIVHTLVVSKLQGSLHCESAPGQGVTFIFHIPKEISDADN